MKTIHRLFISHVALAATLLAAPVPPNNATTDAARGHVAVAGISHLDALVPPVEIATSMDHLATQNQLRLQLVIDELMRQENDLQGDPAIALREAQAEAASEGAALVEHPGKS